MSVGIEGDASTSDRLIVDYEGLLTDVGPGDQLSFGDGNVVLVVEDRASNGLKTRVLHGGHLEGRPGLHIDSSKLRLSTPTPQDLKLTDTFIDLGTDMIALSFVRSAHDMRRLGVEPVPRGPLLVAKIETNAAVENLDGIIEASSAVMVARGDLGAECDIEDLRTCRNTSSRPVSPRGAQPLPPRRCSSRSCTHRCPHVRRPQT